MDANRVEVSTVRETTPGTTPNARFDIARLRGEGIEWQPEYYIPDELRSDRMSSDPVKISENNSGPINFAFSYPEDSSAFATWLRSALMNDWVQQPVADNTLSSGSISSITASSKTITVTDKTGVGLFNGSSFKAAHVVRMSGFSNAANNGFFPVASSTSTTIVLGASFTGADETPSGTGGVRVKVVGFDGGSGDIVATSTGLTSTTANFVTLGLVNGMWIKIGGTGTSRRFGTEANNGWARVASVSANAVTLDHRPTGWTADTGTGKTIRIWTGDTLRNGVTQYPCSIQKRFLSVNPIVRYVHRGMEANTFNIDMSLGGAVMGSFGFVGLNGAQNNISDYAPSYRSAPNWPIYTAQNDVGAIYENGVLTGSPNWFARFGFTVSNNMQVIGGLGYNVPVKITAGECEVGGSFEAYFGSNAIADAVMAQTRSSLYARVFAANPTGGQTAVVFGFPRVTFTRGTPTAPGRNQRVMTPVTWRASKDEALTNSHITIDRFEYWEA